MKSKEKTKQKKHESTIGKIIYGFLLFMPLLAIGVTCTYAIFNKNAYQSYSNKYVVDTINVSNTSELINGREFILLKVGTTDKIQTGRIGFSNISLDLEQITGQSYNYNAINLLGDGRAQFVVRDWTNNVNTHLTSVSYNDLPNTFTFTSDGNFIANNSVATITNSTFDFSYNIYQQEKLDNVFYYSIDKVQQSPLFNWAENSVIYTGMANTCNAIDITTPFIPLLMTYWLIISVIYFLYDIILIILHVFHRKIHELEESI